MAMLMTSDKPVETRKLEVTMSLFFVLLVGLAGFSSLGEQWIFSVPLLGNSLQAFAFAQLLFKLKNGDNVGPLSKQTILTTACAIAIRLVPTTFRPGYLPQQGGFPWCQFFDVVALVLAGGALWVSRGHAVSKGNERLWFTPVSLVLSLGVAIWCHSDMDNKVQFDVAWAAATYAIALAPLSQLLHLHFAAERTDRLPWAYVIPSSLTAVCSTIFWSTLREELTVADDSNVIISEAGANAVFIFHVLWVLVALQILGINFKHSKRAKLAPGSIDEAVLNIEKDLGIV